MQLLTWDLEVVICMVERSVFLQVSNMVLWMFACISWLCRLPRKELREWLTTTIVITNIITTITITIIFSIISTIITTITTTITTTVSPVQHLLGNLVKLEMECHMKLKNKIHLHPFQKQKPSNFKPSSPTGHLLSRTFKVKSSLKTNNKLTTDARLFCEL